MMTKQDMLRIAKMQSAIDSNCNVDDFYSHTNKVVISSDSPNARKYLNLPFYCDLTSYGDNIIASVSEEIHDAVERYVQKYPVEHCFETPNLLVLNDELNKFGMSICFMAEYFLPDIDTITPLECTYETKILTPKDFSEYYLPQWSNALCEKRKSLDVLAVGAFHNGELIGLAGCSADCETMWQIGIDVLPEHRNQGIASALTSQLAIEVIARDIVPFYCCAWSNIKSVRNAIKSGFRPAWVQVTAKSIEFVAEINS